MDFKSLLSGEIDENKQYYTEELFLKDLPAFILYILEEKEIISAEEFEPFKKEFSQIRNAKLIQEAKDFRNSKTDKKPE